MQSDGDGDGDEVMHIRTSRGSGRTEAWGYIGSFLLPIKHRGEELGNETLVIWTEGLDFNGFVALAVQVVWVERAHCGKSTLVLFVREVRVRVLSVPSECAIQVLVSPKTRKKVVRDTYG
jgi:hypothetical protein